MFGLLSDIREFVSLILNLGDYIILGAMIAGIGWLAGRIFFGSLSGLLGAMAVGAGLTVFAVIGDWLGDDSGRVARLEAELKAKSAKIAEITATNAALTNSLVEESEAADHNARIAMDRQKIIDALGSKPECGVSKDFTDALKDIR